MDGITNNYLFIVRTKYRTVQKMSNAGVRLEIEAGASENHQGIRERSHRIHGREFI
jgi:hypothetical protein